MIYLDHAASTPMSETALATYRETALKFPANPSSLHTAGRMAGAALREARERIARIMGCAPHEVIFTSGGSESDHLAIHAGICRAKDMGGSILASAMEHPAVSAPLAAYVAQGGEVRILSPQSDGILSPDAVADAMTERTALVSVMAASNETGILQPWRQIAALCAERGVLFHTDAVQTVGRLDMTLPAQGAILLSASAHKFGGPRGVGFLIARGVELPPLLLGGGQEQGRRPGTENLPAICAMAAALEEWEDERAARTRILQAHDDALRSGLEAIFGCRLTAKVKDALPGHIHAGFDGLDGEAVLWQMDERGIAISTSSACHALTGDSRENRTLASMGWSQKDIRGAVRITASYINTEEEIDLAIRALADICARMRAARSDF